MRRYFKMNNMFFLFMFTSLIVILYVSVRNVGYNPFNRISYSLNTRQMKYILQWTSASNVPFSDMAEGQVGFIKRKCLDVNCYVTPNRTYLGDIKKFDVIVFAGPDLAQKHNQILELPSERSPHQKYVFASIESAENYPLLSERYNGFFNWTWSYKLDSEVRWGYIVIRDTKGTIIGPKKDMHWMKLEDMDPVSPASKEKLISKTKAAAWFVSNCYTLSRREELAYNLRRELLKYGQILDIYGDCGYLSCPKENQEKCDKLIEKKYYFYLAFENSFSEDYVTEKLLKALDNNAVPIVFGGANYSRFLPDGSYLNARKLSVEKLAIKMMKIIRNPKQYLEYFRWKNHYSYHKTSDSVDTNEYCKMCSLLNDNRKVEENSVYEDFTKWWNELSKKTSL